MARSTHTCVQIADIFVYASWRACRKILMARQDSLEYVYPMSYREPTVVCAAPSFDCGMLTRTTTTTTDTYLRQLETAFYWSHSMSSTVRMHTLLWHNASENATDDCSHTLSIAFRHFPPKMKDVVNQCLEFGCNNR